MGSRLEYYRNLANLTRTDLALLVGVDRTVIWRYERGICRPRDKRLKSPMCWEKQWGIFF